MATIDEILAAVKSFEPSQTELQEAQIADVARRRQQQRDQLDFLTGILEAKSAADIRIKQATDPSARLVELLRQPGPTVGRATRGGLEGEPITIPDVLGEPDISGRQVLAGTPGRGAELDFLLNLLAKPATGGAQPPLTAALGQADEIRKILRPLAVEFSTLKPNDPRRKEIISEAQDLFTNAQRIAQGIDAISPGLGATIVLRPLEELFGVIGLREPIARGGQPPAPPGQQPPQPPPQAPQRKSLTPEEREAAFTTEPDPAVVFQFLLRLISALAQQEVGRPVSP